MLSKLSRFLTIATLTTLTCIITHPANADNQDAGMITPTSTTEFNVEEAFTEAFYSEGDFFERNRPGRFFTDTMFGLRHCFLCSYPENNLKREGLLLYTIMNDYYKQLQEDNPTIRTRDLPNPFDTSLKDEPIAPVPGTPVVERDYQIPNYQMQQTQPMPETEPVRGLY